MNHTSNPESLSTLLPKITKILLECIHHPTLLGPSVYTCTIIAKFIKSSQNLFLWMGIFDNTSCPGSLVFVFVFVFANIEQYQLSQAPSYVVPFTNFQSPTLTCIYPSYLWNFGFSYFLLDHLHLFLSVCNHRCDFTLFVNIVKH